MEKVRATVDKKPQSAPKVAFFKSTEKRDDKWSTLLVEVGESQDRRAFAELFAHFAPLLKSFAQASRQDGWFPGLAEDLVQEVMIKVWQKAGGYNPQKASATTWIYTVARNCRIDMLRRKCNTQHLPLENEDFWHEPVIAFIDLIKIILILCILIPTGFEVTHNLKNVFSNKQIFFIKFVTSKYWYFSLVY